MRALGIAIALACAISGCNTSLCSPSNTQQQVVIKDSQLYNTTISQQSTRSFYTACVARPVPAFVMVPQMTPYGMQMMQVPINAYGIGRGANLDDCKGPAIEACEESLSYAFNMYNLNVPPNYRCVMAQSEGCQR